MECNVITNDVTISFILFIIIMHYQEIRIAIFLLPNDNIEADKEVITLLEPS